MYGFDKPAHERFMQMLQQYVRFDLGKSFLQRKDVWALIKEKLPVSISLGLWTFFISYLVAVPLGVAKAVRAAAALADEDFVERSRVLNREGMAQLEAGFTALGLTWIASRANFIAVKIDQAGQHTSQSVFQALLQKGVIVRPVGGYQMPEYIRVSIGLPEENARFLTALAEVLA